MHKNNYTINDSEYCFIHVPKSGGTTFSFYLKKYNIKTCTNINLHQPVNNLFSPNKFKYITILRNPIDRCYSYYQMVKRESPNYPHKKYSNNLENFMNNCWEVNNMATLYYAGIDCSKLKIINVNDEIYNKAINNLKNFHNILDFNNIQNDIITFFKKLNIYLDNKIENKRKVEYNKNLSKNDIVLITKHNEYDIKLYNFIINYKK